MTRRALWASLVIVIVASTAATAQEAFPSRPITVVVAFPPGGLADLTARPVAAAMERLLKQPVVVANKPAASCARSWACTR